MNKKNYLVPALVAAVMLTACGGGQDPVGVAESIDFTAEAEGALETMGFNPGDEVGSSRSDLAAERISGVEIAMDTANFDAQKFAARSAAGDLPDVVQMDRSAIATFAQRGLIMPLGECFAAHGIEAREYWYEGVVDEASYDGEIYGAAQFFQPTIIIINKRVTEAAGVSPEQFDTSQPEQLVEVAGQLTEMSGEQPTRLGFDPNVPSDAKNWLLVFGGRIMDDDGRPALDDPNNIKAFEYLTELLDAQGGYAEVTSFKESWDVFGDENQFVSDQQAAGTWAQWYINVLSNVKDEVSLHAVPLRDLGGNALAIAGGTALAIPTNAENPVAACHWITTVISLEAWEAAGAARAQTVEQNNAINTGLFTGSPIADQAVREAHVVASGNDDFDQLINTTYEVLEGAVSFGSSPVGQQIDEALQQAAGRAFSGEQSPEQALSDAQAQAMTAWDQLGG